LTTARYFTPNGRSIQAKGITPDVMVDDGAQRLSMREADLERHLVGDDEKKALEELKKAAPADAAASKKPVPVPAADEKPVEYKALNATDGKPIDFVLQQALNQLKGLPVASNPRELVAALVPAQGAAVKTVAKSEKTH
jgi:carboxyl-terminal processing protease